MADNTDEEHLENPVNNQPEIPADQIIPPTERETINPNQESENMEVHHHARHEGKKNWKSYFWEFLMLFLAVTLGFFVENQREHYIENQRARQYAGSLIEDLKADTAELNVSIGRTANSIRSADSLLSELDKPAAFQNDTIQQTLTARLIRFNFYDPQLGTYNQLMNSGTLRYFPIEIVKKLNKYEMFAVYIVKVSNQHLDFRIQHLLPLIYKIQNTRFLRSLNNESTYNGPVFIEKPNRQLTEQWYSYTYNTIISYDLIKRRMEKQLKSANELISLLEDKY